MSFTLRSMFLFAAISPEVESIADDNRITRVNLAKPRGPWLPVRNEVKGLFSAKNCAGIRAATWSRLREIIDTADGFVTAIQDKTGQDSRKALSDALSIAAYLLVWMGKETTTPNDAAVIAEVWRASEMVNVEERDEAREAIDRLLDERVMIDSNKSFLTIREALTSSITRRRPNPTGGVFEEISSAEAIEMKNVCGRYGISCSRKGEVVVAKNHHEVMKILNAKKGYQRLLVRHDKCVDPNKNVTVAGASRSCCVFKELLDLTIDENPEYDDIAPPEARQEGFKYD